MTPELDPSGKRGPRGPRGDVQDRVKDAARASFAANGYAGTTLQGIARTAGVDTKLVRYYFTDKETLFAECLVLPPDFLARIGAAADVERDRRGRALVETLIAAWNNPEVAVVLRTAMLIAGHSPRALELVTTAFAGAIIPLVERAVPAADRDLRVGLVASQMLGLAFARYLFELPEFARVPDATIVDSVGPTIQRYLDGDIHP